MDSLANDVSLHPIQRLQIKHQFRMESDQARSNSMNDDIAVSLSKCIDDDLLYKIQSALEVTILFYCII